jgi:3-hydroxyacyl-CoA dehydrogenase
MTSMKVIRFGDGRLNPLGVGTRRHIYSSLEEAKKDSSITSVVLFGGDNFSAGADLNEFHQPASDDISLLDLVLYIEAYSTPVVAAMDGVALGGGLELAMACHYRVCTARSKLGLPEVTVGVIPGAGGTQRLPRLIGVERALEVILQGRMVDGVTAAAWNLVDALCSNDQSLVDCATRWATWATLLPLVSVMQTTLDPKHVRLVCLSARQQLPRAGSEGLQAALEAVDACTRSDGQEIESKLFYQTLHSAQGKARRHGFFAVRTAQKSALAVPTTSPLLTSRAASSQPTFVGVVGAGLMGSGIALVLLQAGFFVLLCDINDSALTKGMSFLQQQIDGNVNKKKWTLAKATTMKANSKGSTSLLDLHHAQLVVEAVVENLNVKKNIFTHLDNITPPSCLLLSNTSTLSIDSIASTLRPARRGYCAGWHYFSPAHMMKLVEIVVGKDTSEETTAILQVLTKRLGKVGVTVGNCDGFVGNRMLNPYSSEAVLLLSQGVATIESIDGALQGEFGLALGPFQMSDLAGNDIGYFIRKERQWTRDPETQLVGDHRPDRYTELGDAMVTELGRMGQKAGKGWYNYDPKIGKGRKGNHSTEMETFVKRFVPSIPGPMLSSQEIIEQVLFPLVNEGFKILEEGIAQKPSDIDVVYLYGYGWPAWRGGPMFWADEEVGLEYLLTKLQELYQQYPGSVYFHPSKLLEKCVQMGVTVQEYYKNGMHTADQGTRSNL